ncbi:MAG: alkaline phosphatase [Proteobacteria bacterium]|nr:alkaline phosphatase [Pseudomonadota bacterium]
MQLNSRISLVVTASLTVLGGASAPAHADSASAMTVPTSGAEWFSAGRAAIEANRLVNRELNTRRARNVILFVGDGMGVSTVTAARILDGQQRGIDGEWNRLSFEKFSDLALSVTASANQQTSDSAPTATAMVAGIKTNDGAISVDQSITRKEFCAEVTRAKSVRTLLERAEERGMSTGVVTTARITHATPAVNYAHVSNRDWEANNTIDSDLGATVLPVGCTKVKDIAAQLVDFKVGNGLEVALGGGRPYFEPNTKADPEYPTRLGRRTDGRDLTAEWAAKPGAAYVWNKAQFDAVDLNRTRHLLGLFEPSHVKYEADRANDTAGEPSLAEMTRKSIQLLKKNPKGFYLMVEGGRIDHAHHAGNAYRALTDTIAMAEAVKVAREMTDDEDTLIIVTADHSHTLSIAGYPSRGNPILGKADTGLGLLGVSPVAIDSLGLPYTTLGYLNGPGGWTGNGSRRELNPATELYTAEIPFTGKRPDLTNVDTTNPNYLQESAIPTVGAETHSGEDVAIYANGPKSYLVRGTLEQNAIYHVMARALGL